MYDHMIHGVQSVWTLIWSSENLLKDATDETFLVYFCVPAVVRNVLGWIISRFVLKASTLVDCLATLENSRFSFFFGGGRFLFSLYDVLRKRLRGCVKHWQVWKNKCSQICTELMYINQSINQSINQKTFIVSNPNRNRC